MLILLLEAKSFSSSGQLESGSSDATRLKLMLSVVSLPMLAQPARE